MSIKTYTISFDTEEQRVTRTNEGFNVFELIGILNMTQEDLTLQLNNRSDSAIEVVKQVVKQ